jgi:hypothetical protein
MHSCERMTEAEQRNIDELISYIKRARESITNCHCEFQALDQYLTDLQDQTEQSKQQIEETHQTFKMLLDKRKEEMLKELEDKHADREMNLMNLHNSIDMTLTQLNDVIRFFERVILNGNR